MSSVVNVVRAGLRCGGPAALAAAAWCLAAATDVGAPLSAGASPAPSAGSAVLVAALLLCPGWGLLRVLSGIDRRFAVLGGSLCLSLLVLGLVGRHAGAPLTTAVHATSLLLCLAGGVRQALFDRWQRRHPRPPQPMPLWPERLLPCLALLALALGAVLLAPSPRTSVSDASTLGAPAARSVSEVVGALSAGAGLDADGARRAVAAACLLAVLLFVSESMSRLRGNRGAPGAMLAALLGFAPLGVLLALLAAGRPWSAGHGAQALLDAATEGRVTAALAPFVDGSPLALALAFTAMLLSSTLSVLRRASFHVPRLAAAAAFGLVSCLPQAALALLPAWIAGVLLAHRMCRRAAAADPASVATLRRAGEPELLRAPFWALALPVAGTGALAFVLAGAGLPALVARPWPDACAVALTLLAALLPAAVLFLPGVRQLNASPGREAWFFTALLPGAALAGLLCTLPDFSPGADHAAGDSLARLLSLLLAVPIANGALQLVDRRGRRALVVLLLVALALLPGTLLLLRSASGPGS